MYKVIKNIFVWGRIAILLIPSIIMINSCAMMPRTVLDSDSGEILESSTVSGQFKIQIMPLNQVAVAENNKAAYTYKFGSRDQVSVYVWGHPEFSSPLGSAFTADRNPLLVSNSNQVDNTTVNKDLADVTLNAYTIDESGNIFLPLIGMVKFEGRTINEVRNEITKRLTEYVVNPQVSIRMASFRSKVTYVLGEVTKPTAIYLNDTPLDLSTALSYAGWVNLTAADVKNIYVMRLVGNMQVKVYRLDATTPTALLFASGFVLEPSDIVFVSTAGVAQFNRVMTQFLNAAQTLWFVTNIAVPNGTTIIQ